MNPREMEKLLGGYATDTLTEEERHSLFAAALENQALFDALADEQALRDLLQDPASRAHLMAALGEERLSLAARIAAWLRRPSVLALAGAVAAGIVLIAVVQPGKRVPTATVAMNKPLQPEPPAPPATATEAGEKKVGSRPPAAREMRQAKKAEPELERDTLALQNAPTRVAAPAAAPDLPPPPAQPQPFGSPAKPLLSLRDAGPAPAPAAAPPPPPPPPAVRKEMPAVANARDLYYAGQPAAGAAQEDSKQANKQKSAGRAFSPGALRGGMARTTARPAAGPLAGIRYSIQQRGLDGVYMEIDPAASLGIGDSVRLRLEANQEGTVAVARREADGTWKPIGEAHVRAGEPVYLPADNPLTIAAAGELQFQVKFLPAAQPQAATDRLTEASRPLRDQVGTSVYVVNPSPAAGAGVEFEIVVKAQ